MASPVSAALRRLVADRAHHLCEYCLIHEDDRGFGCQVDHIISEKHHGKTDLDNLAYACAPCNRAKGSDVGSVAESTGVFTRLYNPRTDIWSEHFRLLGARFVPLTDLGRATERILRFNDAERCEERELLRQQRRYPSAAALQVMELKR